MFFLRRELQECLFEAPIVEEARALSSAGNKRRRGFVSAMVMFTGIDLLAKFAVVGPPPQDGSYATAGNLDTFLSALPRSKAIP